jgi:hypothetical protein
MLIDKRKGLASLILIIIVALLAVACSANVTPAAQAIPEDGGVVTVIGRGEAFGQPDIASVQVGVETFAETVEEATQSNQATLEAIMSAMDELGIASENIQTTNFNLWADQRRGEDGFEGIRGFWVSNQVRVTVLDITQTGKVLQAATKAGANNIFGINFSVSDPAALESEARALAMADAEARATELAELAGLNLGQAKVVSEVIGQPITFPARGGADFALAQSAIPEPGISPGQLSFSVQIQVSYAAE